MGDSSEIQREVKHDHCCFLCNLGTVLKTSTLSFGKKQNYLPGFTIRFHARFGIFHSDVDSNHCLLGCDTVSKLRSRHELDFVFAESNPIFSVSKMYMTYEDGHILTLRLND
jgi:hypothetical protein